MCRVESGACKYCRSLKIPCEASVKTRKRPFYRVSGEVYEYSIKLLRRFVPEDELPELTVDNIQGFLQKLDTRSDTSRSTSPREGQPRELSLEELPPRESLPKELPPRELPATEIPSENEGTAASAEPDLTNETMAADEHPVLQEELGCLLLDSMGKYRMSLMWLARDVTSLDSPC